MPCFTLPKGGLRKKMPGVYTPPRLQLVQHEVAVDLGTTTTAPLTPDSLKPGANLLRDAQVKIGFELILALHFQAADQKSAVSWSVPLSFCKALQGIWRGWWQDQAPVQALLADTNIQDELANRIITGHPTVRALTPDGRAQPLVARLKRYDADDWASHLHIYTQDNPNHPLASLTERVSARLAELENDGLTV